MFSRMVGFLTGLSPPLRAPRRFSLVGVEWSGPSTARIELRAQSADRRWSRWAGASLRGNAGGTLADRSRVLGEPIWTGPAVGVQLRASNPVRGVRLHFVDGGTRGDAAGASPLPRATPTLDAGPGQPPVIARAAWAQGSAHPAVAASYGTVRLAFVHHTETPNGYGSADVPSIMRSIFDFHRYVRGYDDIAYNFMIDAFGRIWEARAGGIDLPVIGAHAGGYNAVSTGIAVIGSFKELLPSAAAIDTLERFLAWKLSLHGLAMRGRVTVEVNPASAFYTPFPPGARVSLPRIAGHRDGGLTDCPGDAFYARLPAIRLRASKLARRVARITLVEPRTPGVAGTMVLSGRFSTLSGQPMRGAPIELQQVDSGGESPVDTVLTGADGRWSLPVALSQSAVVRALHRPPPATASDLVVLTVAPRITLTVQSSAPLRVAGEITPGKRTVTVDAYRLQGSHRRLVASKQVTTQSGRFAATLDVRRPGEYLVIANTKADARNAAGSSPGVRVRRAT